jgi:hypothetical protein
MEMVLRRLGCYLKTKIRKGSDHLNGHVFHSQSFVNFTDSKFAQLVYGAKFWTSRLKSSLPIYWTWTLHRSDIPAQTAVKSAARIKERGNRAWEYWMLFPILCGGMKHMNSFLPDAGSVFPLSYALMNAPITIKHLCIPLKSQIQSNHY